MKRLKLMAGLAIASMGGSVAAPDGGPAGESIAERETGDAKAATLLGVLDQNGDGRLSRAELDVAVGSLRRLDRNGDGIIAEDELAGWTEEGEQEAEDQEDRPRGGRGRTGEVWRVLADRYDQDRNGEIRKEEYPRGEEKFLQLDRSGDGVLTAVDFRGNKNGLAPMGKSRLVRLADSNADERVTAEEWQHFVSSLKIGGEGRVGKGDLERRLRGRGPVKMAARTIESLDVNGDGVLQREEVSGVWASLDRDGDGVVKGVELVRFGRRGGDGARGPDAPPETGAAAPDFELAFASGSGKAEGGHKARLSDYRGKRPVALVFGSYT